MPNARVTPCFKNSAQACNDKLISFYWRDDYKDVLRVAAAPDGIGKTFVWAGGEGTLRRDPAGNTLLLVRERGGREIPVQLKRE